MNIHLVSLGCARNQVDSETMSGLLLQAGHSMTEDLAAAEVIVVNTCSFIEAAINESIDTILEMAEFKKSGVCRRLLVAGCLPERFREAIAAELPEVDMFIGTGAFGDIVNAVGFQQNGPSCLLPDPDAGGLFDQGVERQRNAGPMAYLKIAEGCDRRCTYCIIPQLRGRQKSRSIPHILAEAESLIASGAKELVLVAQETTAYGKDLGMQNGLKNLLQALSAVSKDIWIRLLYGHPQSISAEAIRTLYEAPNICNYFDVPVQHAADAVLRRMGRRYSQSDLIRLFQRIRSLSPGACLRTTLIVGFPGETEKDFADLMQFVADVQFDHLGVFVYSDSEDLPSHKLSGHVPETVAKRRYDAIMSRQVELSRDNNRKYIGRTLQVLVEEKSEENVYLGRTMCQAPEVDGITFIRSGKLAVGDFADVRMVDALEYDLVGEA
ncbi:MAG: 30S ribosomal protein S12 methylthiotransferase RimO [Deltaproteobacteria bacterium]